MVTHSYMVTRSYIVTTHSLTYFSQPANVLLTEFSENATLKLADFGFAKHLAEASMAQTPCGTPLYMAPEIFEMHEYDAKVSIPSLTHSLTIYSLTHSLTHLLTFLLNCSCIHSFRRIYGVLVASFMKC